MPYADPLVQREYQRVWAAKRRAEFFTDKECVRCGSTDNLELDHIKGSEKVDHRIWSWARARREAELAKCQVLCHAHHLEKTLADRPKTDHGRGAMYNPPYRCRCVLCRAWKRDDDAKRRSSA